MLLDLPGSSYWKGWERFVTEEVATRGLINPGDVSLYRIVDRVEDAATEILGFYRNYHSLRWVGDTLVIRLESRPTEAEAAALSERVRRRPPSPDPRSWTPRCRPSDAARTSRSWPAWPSASTASPTPASAS